jgi:hypothetical protein
LLAGPLNRCNAWRSVAFFASLGWIELRLTLET